MKRDVSPISDSSSSDSVSSDSYEATRQPVTEHGEESHVNKTESTTEHIAESEEPDGVKLSDREARTQIPTRKGDKLTTSIVTDGATTNVVQITNLVMTTEVTALERTTQFEQKAIIDTQTMTSLSKQSESDGTTISPTTLDSSQHVSRYTDF